MAGSIAVLYCVLNPSPLPPVQKHSVQLQFAMATFLSICKIFHVNSRFLGTDLNIVDRKRLRRLD